MFLKQKKYFLIITFLVFCFLIYHFVLADGIDIGAASPLKEGTTLTTLIVTVMKSFLSLMGVIALAVFVWGGALWMTSGGNEETIKKGKDTIVWAVAGLALIFFSYAFLNYVIKALLSI